MTDIQGRLIKNLTESFTFPAASLLSSDLPKEYATLVASYITEQDDSKKAEFRTLVVNATPKEIKADLDRYGVELPSDKLVVTLQLKDLLFDLYTANLKSPAAPLARKLLEKRVGEVAEALSKPEFVVPQDAKGYILRALNDDETWSKMQVSGAVSKPADPEDAPTVSITIRAEFIARFFPKIINAAVSAFLEEELGS